MISTNNPEITAVFLKLKIILRISAHITPSKDMNIKPFGPPINFNNRITPIVPKLAPNKSKKYSLLTFLEKCVNINEIDKPPKKNGSKVIKYSKDN